MQLQPEPITYNTLINHGVNYVAESNFLERYLTTDNYNGASGFELRVW